MLRSADQISVVVVELFRRRDRAADPVVSIPRLKAQDVRPIVRELLAQPLRDLAHFSCCNAFVPGRVRL